MNIQVCYSESFVSSYMVEELLHISPNPKDVVFTVTAFVRFAVSALSQQLASLINSQDHSCLESGQAHNKTCFNADLECLIDMI